MSKIQIPPFDVLFKNYKSHHKISYEVTSEGYRSEIEEPYIDLSELTSYEKEILQSVAKIIFENGLFEREIKVLSQLLFGFEINIIKDIGDKKEGGAPVFLLICLVLIFLVNSVTAISISNVQINVPARYRDLTERTSTVISKKSGNTGIIQLLKTNVINKIPQDMIESAIDKLDKTGDILDIASELKPFPKVDNFLDKMTKVLKVFKICGNIPVKQRIELMLEIVDINPMDKINDIKKEAISSVLTQLLGSSSLEIKCFHMLAKHSTEQYKALIEDVGPDEAIKIASGLFGGSSKRYRTIRKLRTIRRRIKKNRRTRRNKSYRK
jgi:hypothetical protein